jgi:hypothetical protein
MLVVSHVETPENAKKTVIEHQKYIMMRIPRTLISAVQNTYVLGWWSRDIEVAQTKPSERMMRAGELNILCYLKCKLIIY